MTKLSEINFSAPDVSRTNSTVLNRSLMHTAAKLHYIEGLSQVEVSRKLQISTASVSRLLARAREEAIVRIHVADLDEIDEIGDRLQGALGLVEVRVVDTAESGAVAALSSQIALLLRERELSSKSVIAIGWGRTVQSVIAAGLPKIPGVTVVPTMGGLDETASHFQINEFVRVAAEAMQGSACFLHAPSLPSPELRAVLQRDRATSRILDLWPKIDVAILGIGDFKNAATNRDIAFDRNESDRVVGDIVRHYFDEDGHEIDWPGHADLMAVTAGQLRRTPLSIGIATGAEKVRAIIGAARSRMINSLVTDSRTARLLVEKLGTQP